jgi:hypothetical protein
MFPTGSHVALKRGLFHYRRVVPQGGWEVTLSLRTLDYREARYRAGLLDRAFDRVLKTNRQMADLKAILREELAATLRADLEQHLDTRPGASVYGTAPHDDQTSALDHDLDLIDMMIGDAHDRLVTRDTSLVMPHALALAARHGLPADQVTELAVGLLQVELQAMQEGKRRLLNGAVDPVRLDVPSPVVAIAPPVAAEPAGPLLSAAMPQFIEHMTSRDKWRGHPLFLGCHLGRL